MFNFRSARLLYWIWNAYHLLKNKSVSCKFYTQMLGVIRFSLCEGDSHILTMTINYYYNQYISIDLYLYLTIPFHPQFYCETAGFRTFKSNENKTNSKSKESNNSELNFESTLQNVPRYNRCIDIGNCKKACPLKGFIFIGYPTFSN